MDDASLIIDEAFSSDPPLLYSLFIFADSSGLLPRGLGHKGKILLRLFRSPNPYGLFRALNQSTYAIQPSRSVRSRVLPQNPRPLASPSPFVIALFHIVLEYVQYFPNAPSVSASLL